MNKWICSRSLAKLWAAAYRKRCPHRSVNMLLAHTNQQAMPARTATSRPLCIREVGAWHVYMLYIEVCDRFPGCKLEMMPHKSEPHQTQHPWRDIME